MNFMGVTRGDHLYVKLAFSIYSIIDITVTVTNVSDDGIEASWDDIEDMKQCIIVFDRQTGIAKALPKKYNKTTCWIMRYDGDRRSEFR